MCLAQFPLVSLLFKSFERLITRYTKYNSFFTFLPMLVNFGVCFFFFWWGEWFWVAFLLWLVMLSVFYMLVDNLYIIFGEMSVQVLFPFLILDFLFLMLLMSSYRSSVYILDTKSLSAVWFTNIFSPSVGNSVECNLWCTEVFNLM